MHIVFMHIYLCTFYLLTFLLTFCLCPFYLPTPRANEKPRENETPFCACQCEIPASLFNTPPWGRVDCAGQYETSKSETFLLANVNRVIRREGRHAHFVHAHFSYAVLCTFYLCTCYLCTFYRCTILCRQFMHRTEMGA